MLVTCVRPVVKSPSMLRLLTLRQPVSSVAYVLLPTMSGVMTVVWLLRSSTLTPTHLQPPVSSPCRVMPLSLCVWATLLLLTPKWPPMRLLRLSVRCESLQMTTGAMLSLRRWRGCVPRRLLLPSLLLLPRLLLLTMVVTLL